jgi:hypothetical protein
MDKPTTLQNLSPDPLDITLNGLASVQQLKIA